MNIFITEIDQMDSSSWSFAESVYGEDRIMFIPDSDGKIPYFTVKKLNALTVDLEFLPINMDEGIEKIIFSLALACSDVENATVYICSPNSAFEQLNDTEFDTRNGGKINIVVCEGMDCISYNDGDSEIVTDGSDGNENILSGDSVNTYKVPDITIPDPDDLEQELSPEPEESLDNEEKSNEIIDNDNSSSLSIRLLNTMREIDKTGTLTKNANIIVDAIKENEDGSIMTLNFIIHEKIDDNAVADAIMNILGEDTVIDQLTKSI